MSWIDLPTMILRQVPTRTRLADTRALMQRVQAAAEREWERELARGGAAVEWISEPIAEDRWG